MRPEAAAAVALLHRMGLTTAILSGDAEPAVAAVAAAVDIDSARSGLTPSEKLGALRTMQAGAHRVVMVGDGVNDAPALAAADVGCAVGSGSDAALANSDVALLGTDLHGVPAAVGIAGSTSAVIVQNFGWAMGYNISALPLAAAGLLDPLVAAAAMGLSSLIVVLNSLRLVRLGRAGVDRIRPPKVLRGARGFALSVAVPVLLFAGATVGAQAVSPSRGQPLLPSLPSISDVALPHGVGAEVYLGSITRGVNQFHLFLTTSSGVPGSTVRAPHVIATPRRGPRHPPAAGPAEPRPLHRLPGVRAGLVALHGELPGGRPIPDLLGLPDAVLSGPRRVPDPVPRTDPHPSDRPRPSSSRGATTVSSPRDRGSLSGTLRRPPPRWGSHGPVGGPRSPWGVP